MRNKTRKLMAFGAGGLAALSVRAVAFAQEGDVTVPVGSGTNGYGLWDWLQIGFRLALVLAVIWGAFVIMRWYMRRVNGDAGAPGTRQLQIVETRNLGPNRALHLVRVGGRAVLIGVTQERINQLMAFDDPEEVERLSELPPAAETRSFRSFMSSLPGGRGAMGTMGASRANGAGDGPEQRRGGRDGAPRDEAAPAGGRGRGRGRGRGIVRAVGGVLRRVAGLPARPRGGTGAARAQAPAPAAPAPAARGGLFDATPASALALRARSGYGAARSGAPAPPAAGAARRRPGAQAPVNRNSRAALGAAAEAAARAAARTPSSREAQISELQRAIASARRDLGIDAAPGRIG